MKRFLAILTPFLAVLIAAAQSNPAPESTTKPAATGSTNAVKIVNGKVMQEPPFKRLPVFKFADGDRVALLGDTLIEREQTYGYLETRLLQRHREMKLTCRNLGWSGDTPAGISRVGFDGPETGMSRIQEQIAALQPTAVLIGYGMASSFDGTNAVPAFKQELKNLIELIDKTVTNQAPVRYLLLGPISHEPSAAWGKDVTAHVQTLRAITKAIQEVAEERNTSFLPLVNAFYVDPKKPREIPWTDDGIHLGAQGYWSLAGRLEDYLKVGAPQWRLGISTNGTIRDGTAGTKVANFKQNGTGFSFTGTDEFLISNPAPIGADSNRVAGTSARTGISGLPAQESFSLLVDGAPVMSATGAKWSEAPYWWTGPMFDDAEELRRLVIRKNQLFFYRWRPQNITYLTGFRKHEQGRNAADIPKFDPLIAEVEAKIQALLTLKQRTYEVRPSNNEDTAKLFTARLPRKESWMPDANSRPAPVETSKQTLPVFELEEGLEISLFAENPDLAKPIQMNFDPKGRLWIASSAVYPQIKPGEEADDKILILEDTNGDGKADKSTVFARGLLIPTGVEPGDGGAYVANSTELVHFKDTNGDGKADQRKVVLSGFGTEDTHHILHTLRWGFDGQLHFNQSIYIHSHLETPHGVVRLNSGGIFSFRPGTGELSVLMRGLCNPWGHHFDDFGQSFATDGAGGDGISWVMPGAMYFTYAGAPRLLGSVSPGSYPKFCGLEVIQSPHFPEKWQGTFVTSDFRAHRVVRFSMSDQESGYVTQELPDVVRSTNVTFRPIDAKIGPDGALYIADWSNPIIQHGEVDFRDPRRDHEHGRIWRVTYKGGPITRRRDFSKEKTEELLNLLLSQNGHERQQARRVLAERGRHQVLPALESWALAHPQDSQQLQALWMFEALNVGSPDTLANVLKSGDGRIRAAGVRTIGDWSTRLTNSVDLLAKAVTDTFPRVRIEAQRALATIPSARSAELVLSTVESKLDRFTDYAAWLSINDLAKPWIEALDSGKWKLEEHLKQLEFALKALPPATTAKVISKVLPQSDLPRDGSGPWIDIIAAAGGQSELQRLFNQAATGKFDDAASARAVAAVASAVAIRGANPGVDGTAILALLKSTSPALQAESVKLVAASKPAGAAAALTQLASSESTSQPVRDAAIAGLRGIGGSDASDALAALGGKQQPVNIRLQAAQALTGLDQNKGAALFVEAVAGAASEEQALAAWRGILSVKGSAAALAKAVPKSGFPLPAAKAGLRAAREGGRNEPNLVLALARNLDAEGDAKGMTPDELKALAARVVSVGDAARGELIYRRPDLACFTCHSIGGVGGKVGPDMTSIGASAPVDYLIESIQFPNRKVKEGFNSLLVETKDGDEFTGILVRETAEALVIRDTQGKDVSIPKDKIAKRAVSGSIMPSGLVDSLDAQQQLDLYKFLSELGKPGAYDSSRGNVARTWFLRPVTLEINQFGDEKALAGGFGDPGWARAASLVGGQLLQAELKTSINSMKWRDPREVYAGVRFQAAKEGEYQFKTENLSGAPVWLDGKPVQLGAPLKIGAGAHTLAFKLESAKFPESVRVAADNLSFLTE